MKILRIALMAAFAGALLSQNAFGMDKLKNFTRGIQPTISDVKKMVEEGAKIAVNATKTGYEIKNLIKNLNSQRDKSAKVLGGFDLMPMLAKLVEDLSQVAQMASDLTSSIALNLIEPLDKNAANKARDVAKKINEVTTLGMTIKQDVMNNVLPDIKSSVESVLEAVKSIKDLE